MVMGNDLLATLREQAEYVNYYRSAPPMACPNDGEPLQVGPPDSDGMLYCRFDGFQYPRDWDPNTMAGM